MPLFLVPAAAQATKDSKNEKYIQFWKVFGKNIKLGVIEDSSNRTKLSKVNTPARMQLVACCCTPLMSSLFVCRCLSVVLFCC